LRRCARSCASLYALGPFLCGDAAHIVPPTGVFNTAASDVHYLFRASGVLRCEATTGLERILRRALAQVWKTEAVQSAGVVHLSLICFPEQSEFELRMQRASDFLRGSDSYRRAWRRIMWDYHTDAGRKLNRATPRAYAKTIQPASAVPYFR
jgi:hypothetical protein